MARYFVLNGDRITGVVEYTGPKPFGPDVTTVAAPDGFGADWVGKSYKEATQMAATRKDSTKEVKAPKDAAEGVREDEEPGKGGLHHSGEIFNDPTATTIAAEHPLDPVLGSQMRTPQPELHVAIVPASQPKTDEQAAKDAGEIDASAAKDAADRRYSSSETATDRAKAMVEAQEKRAAGVRPPTSQPAPSDNDVKAGQPRTT